MADIAKATDLLPDIEVIDKLFGKYSKPILLGASAFIGGAIVVDAGQRIASKIQVKRELAREEKELKRRQKEYRAKAQEMDVPMAFSDGKTRQQVEVESYEGLVQSLYERRIGHYKQGNARFM